MYSVIKTAVVCGFESLPVQVETDVSDGMPSFDMVGFLTSEVKEARERVRTALKNAGFRLPAKKITINLTPADVRKSGTGCDLPMAASVLAAFGFLDEHILSSYLLLGGIIELVYIVLQSVVKPGITGFFKIDLHIKCYIYLS